MKNPNLSLLKKAYDGDELKYFAMVLRRLSKIFARVLTDPEKLALMGILTLYTFEFRDGFVMNRYDDPNYMIGRENAAALIACLPRTPGSFDRDQLGWARLFGMCDKSSEEYVRSYRSLLGEIMMSPSIAQTSR